MTPQSSKPICLALTLMVPLASIMPPGYGHAHVGGEHSHHHQHPSGLMAVAGHGHGLAHGHHHEDDQDRSASQIGHSPLAVPHYHFNFLLFEVAIPAPDSMPFEPEDTDGLQIVNWWLPDAAVAAPQAKLIIRAACEFSTGLIPSWIIQVQKVELSPALPVTTSYLCDTARHERSGVQLA